MAREAAGILDDDDAHPVADDALEQRLEAWAALDRVLARHRGIVEFAGELEPRAPSEGRDRFTLSTIAVLVRADVGCRARAQIGQSWHSTLVGSCHDLAPSNMAVPEKTRGDPGADRLSCVELRSGVALMLPASADQ
jgi:hypothetical protein